MADLLTQMLGANVSSEAMAYLLEKTDGNPFFVQQLALDLQERGLLLLNSERNIYTLHQTEAGEMPTTLNTVLVSRLDRLGTAVKEVVQTAAVLGREFEVLLLSQMLTAHTDDISAQVSKAEQAQIWSALTELRYLFRHALMRDAAYGMQLQARLQTLHQVAAEAIIQLYADDLAPHSAVLAYHYDQAGQVDKARHCYQETAQQATEQYANQEAIRATSRALELTPDDDLETRFTLIEARSKLYKTISDRVPQKADVDTLITLATEMGDQARLAEAYYKSSTYFIRGNQTEEAITLLEKTLDLNEPLQNNLLAMRVYTGWAQTLWQSGQYDLAREKLAIAYPLAQAEGSDREAEVLSSLSIVCGISGDVAGAIDAAEKALVLHRQGGNRLNEAMTLNSLGIQARRLGNYSEAEVYYETSSQILQELGFRFGVAVLSNNLALVGQEQGQYEQAKQRLELSIEVSKDIGIKRNEAWGLAHLALVELRLGNIEAARRAATKAIPAAEANGDPDVDGYAALYQGHVLAASEKWDEATAVYQQAVNIRQKLEQTNLSMEPLAGLVGVALAQSKATQAQTEAEAILAQLDEDSALSGTNEPFRVHLTAFQYLHERGDERAMSVLERAHKLLLERAQKISNPAMRQSFLENVEAHKEIIKRAG